MLKNAIDWGARPYGKTSWPGKPAAVTGTSGGAISTAIAQQHLRAVLGDLGLHVIGGEAYIQFKPDLIDAQGNVTDDSVRKFLKAFIDQFAAFAARFAARSAPTSRGLNRRRTNVMSIRPVKRIVQSKPTIEGAGVKLRRAFGFGETAETDPFLLLDDFRNDHPADYLAGFPWHPHRGIETITYVLNGTVEHRRQPRQPRHARLRRRAMDDRRARHHASGNAAGRRAGPHARLPALGQPALFAEDDGAALSGRQRRGDPRDHR